MGRGKSLAKNTAVIALGKISTQFISFILLPLYTSLLSTKEYGIVDLLNTYNQLLLPIATLMIEQGVFRYLVIDENKDNSRKNIISSSFIIITFINIAFAIVGLFTLKPIIGDYGLYLIPILVTSSFLNWCLQIARGFRRLDIFALGSFISTVLIIISNIILIAVFKTGAVGMLIAMPIGNIGGIMFLVYKLKIYSYVDLKAFEKNISKKLLVYSVPLIPNTLSLWIINSSDRTIVNYFLGAGANGILAISHKFPNIINTFYSIFQLSWHELGAVHWNDPDRDTFFNDIIHKIIRAFSALCICVISVMPLVFKILVPNPEYADSYMTIPVYIIAVLLNIIVGLLGVVYVATKRTGEIAKTTILAGIINISLHLLFVKYIGLYAAAFSTFIAYCVVLVYRYFDTKKYLPLKIDIKEMILISAGLAVTVMCYYTHQIWLNAVGIILALLFSFLLCRSFLDQIISLIRNRFKLR